MHTDNPVLEHLKAICGELADIKCDTSDIRQRMSSLDSSVIELRRSDLHLHEDWARQ